MSSQTTPPFPVPDSAATATAVEAVSAVLVAIDRLALVEAERLDPMADVLADAGLTQSDLWDGYRRLEQLMTDTLYRHPTGEEY